MTLDVRAKALAACRYNDSKLGTILMAAFEVEPIAPRSPRFASRASVTSDGFVMCSFTNRKGEHHMGAFVGEADDVWQNVRGLTAHLGLHGEDERVISDAVQRWLGVKP